MIDMNYSVLLPRGKGKVNVAIGISSFFSFNSINKFNTMYAVDLTVL